MKKIHFLIGIIVLFITGIGVYSCQSDKDSNNGKTNVITAESLEFVGIEHNQMLEECFEFLKKEYQNNNLSNKSLIDKKQKLEDFLISKIQANTRYSKESNDLGVENIKKTFLSTKSREVSKPLTGSIDNFAVEIPSQVKEYLKELYEVLDEIDINKSNTNIERQISALERKIEKDNSLTEKDLIILFSSTQTARYSYKYWKENIHKWESLNPNKSNLTLKKIGISNIYANSENGDCFCNHAKDIVKYDVGGAVGGATTAAIVNAVPGWGQVAYGSAIVGGAAAASVTEGVKKLLDWLW